MLHHRRAARFLNAVIVFSLLGLVYIYFQRPSTDVDSATRWSQQEIDPTLFRIAGENKKGEIVDRLIVVDSPPISAQRNVVEAEDNINRIFEKETEQVVSLSDWQLRDIAENSNLTGRKVVESVEFLNENARILNTDSFGPVENVKSVIVIQVHNRITYLEILIETLRRATGIDNTLLVFSHDISVPEINRAIQRIKFARVLQIFYPFNIQLFPHVFPGQNSADCPEKIKKTEAQKLGCRNWHSPDKYGNYRVSKLTQIKHHWWWKMNYVFDRIISRYGLEDKWVVLLEEDHYVTPDFVHVLTYMTENKTTLCPQCEILCLGIYVKNFKTTVMHPDLLSVAPWYSSKFNMGMAIQKGTWNVMKNCSKIFCTWDDYNWDWSMLQVSVQCLPSRWRVMYTKAPRVVHIGDCGVHTHRCNSKAGADMAAEYVSRHAEKFYPSSMRVNDVSRRMLKPSKANGGWGDPRDHSLCERNTEPTRMDGNFEQVLDELYASTIHAKNTAENAHISQPFA